MPETIIALPLYEPLVMGQPLYMIIIGALVLIIAFAIMLFKMEVYDRLQPVWEFRAASAENAPLAIVKGMSGKILFKSVNSLAGIFEALDLSMKWIITVPTQGQLGKVNCIFVCDDWNIVHNLDLDYAIYEAVQKWNDLHPEGNEAHIYNFDTFNDHLMNGDLDAMFPFGVKLPPFRVVNLVEIKRYLPEWNASHHAGYIIEEINKNKKEEDGNKGWETMKWLLFGGTAFLIMCGLGYILLTSAH